MSRKRKRKRSQRPRPAPQAGDAAAVERAADERSTDRADGDGGPAADEAPARPRGLFRGATQSPFPRFGASVVQGFGALGRSPLILAVAFLSAIATWATFVALGTAPTLRFLVVEMSASPLHVFIDSEAIFRAGGSSTFTLGATVAVAILRSASFGLLLLLLAGAFRDGRPDLRWSLQRLPKVGLSLFAVYVGEVALVVSSQLLIGVLGPSLSILVVIVALHFLAFVPVVVAVEGTTARDGLRRGVRAARLPGGRHLGLALAYFVFTLYIVRLAPPVSPATPTSLGWAFTLAATFVHIGVVSTFTFRWLAVREHPIVTGEVPRTAARR